MTKIEIYALEGIELDSATKQYLEKGDYEKIAINNFAGQPKHPLSANDYVKQLTTVSSSGLSEETIVGLKAGAIVVGLFTAYPPVATAAGLTSTITGGVVLADEIYNKRPADAAAEMNGLLKEWRNVADRKYSQFDASKLKTLEIIDQTLELTVNRL